MDTNYQMLKVLLKQYTPREKGIATREEIGLITKTLHIKDMDILQLRNLRDFTVMYLTKDEDNDENWDKMSAITSVIDHQILSLGGEV